jgi:HPt (histidine-containing phosphotransfer) domain-containing protein
MGRRRRIPFSADIATAQTQLATLIANGDLLAAARVVHKLVGLSDMLSARTLSTELRKLETLIRTEDIETLHAALQTADEVMRRTRTQLDHLILLEDARSPR